MSLIQRIFRARDRPTNQLNGISIKAVIIPDGCESISQKAFANCPELIYVRIPASVNSVAEDAFEGSDKVKIDWINR